jgi:hypothetical protein
MSGSNIQIVLCRTAISVASATTKFTGSISGLNLQSASGAQFGTVYADVLLNLPSNNVNVQFSDVYIPGATGEVLDFGVSGSSTERITIDGLYVERFGSEKPSAYCIRVNSNNSLVSLGSLIILNPDNATGGKLTIGGGYPSSGDVCVDRFFAWDVFENGQVVTRVGNGSWQSLRDLVNNTPLKSVNPIQARIVGAMYVTTAQAGGTVGIRLGSYPEIQTSISGASVGQFNFDTKWIDITSPISAIGFLQANPSSGVVIQNSFTVVMFR